MSKEEEYKKIMTILEQSVVVDDTNPDNTIGDDLYKIAKELTSDENVFRFSNEDKLSSPWVALLGAISDVPDYPKEIKSRYSFMRSFLRHRAICRGAIKSEMANRYKEMGSSLIGFGGNIEYRQAGIPDEEGNKKSSIVDRLKKG